MVCQNPKVVACAEAFLVGIDTGRLLADLGASLLAALLVVD